MTGDSERQAKNKAIPSKVNEYLPKAQMIFYDYLRNCKSIFFFKLKCIKFNELSPNFRIIDKYSVFFPIISSHISLNYFAIF
jgi:hypothetical protein